MKLLSSVFALAVLLAAPASFATTWDLDPAHTNIGFVVRHLVVSKVRGNFKSFKGTVHIDDKDISKSKVELEIDAASIDTGVDKRDEHLRSPDFFDVKKHPKITFKSKSVKQTKKGELLVVGDLTMHGVTKAVLLKVEGPSPEVKDPWGNAHIAFAAEGELNRYDYGLKWNKAIEGGGLTVSEEVQLVIETELMNKR